MEDNQEQENHISDEEIPEQGKKYQVVFVSVLSCLPENAGEYSYHLLRGPACIFQELHNAMGNDLIAIGFSEPLPEETGLFSAEVEYWFKPGSKDSWPTSGYKVSSIQKIVISYGALYVPNGVSV